MTLSASFVLITTGNRPAELRAALDSIHKQTVPGQIVLVFNGCEPTDHGPDVETIGLEVNVGIPAGRNVGIKASTGNIVFFLHDDGSYENPDTARNAINMFADDQRLAVLSFRIDDPHGAPTQRRHVPRLKVGDPSRGSRVTTFLGGACAVRRETFDDVGLFPGQFFYAHEETDLAWRAMDAGWNIRYEPTLAIVHPSNDPSRERRSIYLAARNRVFLARRRLPWPLAFIYVPVWFLLSMVRSADRFSVLRGFAAGVSQPAGKRSPISWRTAYAMTRLGRPPVI